MEKEKIYYYPRVYSKQDLEKEIVGLSLINDLVKEHTQSHIVMADTIKAECDEKGYIDFNEHPNYDKYRLSYLRCSELREYAEYLQDTFLFGRGLVTSDFHNNKYVCESFHDHMTKHGGMVMPTFNRKNLNDIKISKHAPVKK